MNLRRLENSAGTLFGMGNMTNFKGKVTSNWGIKRSRIESPGSGCFF